MIWTLLVLLILAGNLATLPQGERAAAVIAVAGTLVTGFLLVCTDAGLAMAPASWFFDVSLTLTILNCLLGASHESDADNHTSEIR